MKNFRFVRLILASLLAIPLRALAVAVAGPAVQEPPIKFAQAAVYDSGGLVSESVAIADLRGNGKFDLVVANEWWGDNSAAGTVSVLLGNGDGTFQPAVTYNTGAYYAYSVAVGDVNDDGAPDLVVANGCLNLGQSGACNGNGAVSVLLGNGDGTFQPAVTYDLGVPGADSVAIADLRGDGILDLVVADSRQGQDDGAVAVMLGKGDGTFEPAVNYSSGGVSSNSVAVGDLRGNGVQDLVVASGYGDNVVGVLLGNGDGTFQAPVTYVLDGILYDAVAVADLNGDGIPDLAVVAGCEKLRRLACVGDTKASVMLGNGDGTFRTPIAYGSGGSGGAAIAIGDVNGDGRRDLIVVNSWQSPGNEEGTVGVLLNETYYASKTALTSSPNPSQVNQSVTFTATITTTPPVPNGEVVTFYNGKASLGTGNTTDGVAALTTSFSAAKTSTIKASYPGDAFRKPSSGKVKQVVQ